MGEAPPSSKYKSPDEKLTMFHSDISSDEMTRKGQKDSLRNGAATQEIQDPPSPTPPTHPPNPNPRVEISMSHSSNSGPSTEGPGVKLRYVGPQGPTGTTLRNVPLCGELKGLMQVHQQTPLPNPKITTHPEPDSELEFGYYLDLGRCFRDADLKILT